MRGAGVFRLPGRDWLLLCTLHGVASMLGWWALESSVQGLVWRVDDWPSRWWTWWTTAWVHTNTPQLITNQMALGVLTALAWRMRPDGWCALAWFLAWPLTYLSVAWWPQVGWVSGLSGVLHAAVAVMAVHLLLQRLPVPQGRRWGVLLALALLGKLLLEQAWSRPVVWDGANSMSVVQAAWLGGALAGTGLGLLTAWGARLLERARQRAGVH
jgi:hypothetical protein